MMGGSMGPLPLCMPRRTCPPCPPPRPPRACGSASRECAAYRRHAETNGQDPFRIGSPIETCTLEMMILTLVSHTPNPEESTNLLIPFPQ